MLSTHEVHRNGPYLRVIIPDVLPPDWGALRKDVKNELDEGGVDRVTIVTPHFSYDQRDRASLISFFYDVSSGVDTCIEWRDRVSWTMDEDAVVGPSPMSRSDTVSV